MLVDQKSKEDIISFMSPHVSVPKFPSSFLPRLPRVSNILRDQWVQMGRWKVWIKNATKPTDGKIQRSFVKHFSLQPTKSKLKSPPHFETTFSGEISN